MELTHTVAPRKPRTKSDKVAEREMLLAELLADKGQQVTVKLIDSDGQPITDADGNPQRERFEGAHIVTGEILGGLADASIIPTVLKYARENGHAVSTARRGDAVIVYGGEHVTEAVPAKGKK